MIYDRASPVNLRQAQALVILPCDQRGAETSGDSIVKGVYVRIIERWRIRLSNVVYIQLRSTEYI